MSVIQAPFLSMFQPAIIFARPFSIAMFSIDSINLTKFDCGLFLGDNAPNFIYHAYFQLLNPFQSNKLQAMSTFSLVNNMLISSLLSLIFSQDNISFPRSRPWKIQSVTFLQSSNTIVLISVLIRIFQKAGPRKPTLINMLQERIPLTFRQLLLQKIDLRQLQTLS